MDRLIVLLDKRKCDVKEKAFPGRPETPCLIYHIFWISQPSVEASLLSVEATRVVVMVFSV